MPMKKRKWFVPVVLVSILLVGGITGGVVASANNSSSSSEDQSQATDRYQALLDRVCAIYEEQTGVAIDPEQLRNAWRQARGEMVDAAVENWLQNLVDNGKITEEEAQQYLDWWEARPDVEVPLPKLARLGHEGGMMLGGGFQAWNGLGAPDASDEAGD